LGSVVWISLLTTAGYIFGANYEKVGTYLKPISTIVLIGIVAITIYLIIKKRKALY
jgi:membrane protein DedA with SNARE-associated domain